MAHDNLAGPAGVARRVPLERYSSLPGASATVDYWWIRLADPHVMLVEVPEGSDPTMVAADNISLLPIAEDDEDRIDTFVLALISLADRPGLPPANKRFPWYTHELMVATADPAAPHEFDDPAPWPMLQPINLHVQFEVADDDQARHVAVEAVRAVVMGLLPAEVQAFVPQLHKMMTIQGLWDAWQGAINATAQHARTGGTHEEPHPRSGS